MQVSTATDLASKGQGGSENSNMKVKVEVDDRTLQSETKVRCVCGNQLEAESMIQVLIRFRFEPNFSSCFHFPLVYCSLKVCHLFFHLQWLTCGGSYDDSVRIGIVKCGNTLIVF